MSDNGKSMNLRAKDILNPRFPFKIYSFCSKTSQEYHSHDYIQLWYVKKGQCVHNFNGTIYTLHMGDVFVLPPGIFHSVSTEDDDSVLIGLDFTEAFINEDMAGGKSSDLFDYAYIEPFIVKLDEVKPLFPLAGPVSRTVALLLEEIMAEYEGKAPHYQLIVKANLLKILALISREYGRGIDQKKKALVDRYKTAVYQVQEYVDVHYPEKIYLEEMCRMTMLSPSYFSDVFKHVTGRTFTEYVSHVRVEKAKELLRRDDKSISGIAYAVGFSDNAHFDKVFKREVGISPLQFRKNVE